MSKIVKIKFENFKAISELEADFKGCTAIVTGGNNKGKSSFLKGMPERIRYIRPEVMVKAGSTAGRGQMTLDTGERFEWNFNNEGKDTIQLFTSEGAKRSLTKELGATYFPTNFDIDKFMNSTPKEQAKQLQKIVGIDFSDIEKRYADAYTYRTDKNRDAEKFQVKLTQMMEVPKVDFVDITNLQAKKEAERQRLNTLFLKNKATNAAARTKWNEDKQSITDAENKRVKDLYDTNKAANDKSRKEWAEQCDAIRKQVQEFNDAQAALTLKYNKCYDAASILTNEGCPENEIGAFLVTISSQMKPQILSAADKFPAEPTYAQEKFDPIYDYPAEPTDIPEGPNDEELVKIDNAIATAIETNTRAQAYKDYVDYKASVEAAKIDAEQADAAVKVIEDERNALIASANFPNGIAITAEGLTVDGLPLDRNQLSSSRITIAALQIAAINLGEVKALFFDASYLDKNSLKEVNDWAAENNLQLLIERPDFDGGDITYTLIEDAQ